MNNQFFQEVMQDNVVLPNMNSSYRINMFA
jgi:hypothetical protein